MKTTQTFALALLTAAASSRPTRRGALFGGDSNNGDACIAAQALADGIQSNINLQRGEQASLARVKDAVSGGDLVDLVAFAAAKQQLLDFVNAGIAVRTNNQLIAPGVNAALAGLGVVSSPEGKRSVFCFATRWPMLTSVAYFQVQQAQAEELALATALAGNANDLAIIDQLEKDFAGGIQQNEQNALDVSLLFHILSRRVSQLPPASNPPSNLLSAMSSRARAGVRVCVRLRFRRREAREHFHLGVWSVANSVSSYRNGRRTATNTSPSRCRQRGYSGP